jgi:glycosyltransferase involved in cell wall biosynthesis
MKLSIAVCVHDEKEYISSLLKRLFRFTQNDGRATGHEYEIVVIYDGDLWAESDDIHSTFYHLNSLRSNYGLQLYAHRLNGDFATHKNFMNSKCSGDWILNLDADEWVSEDVLFNLTAVIEHNPDVEAYWFPRVNTVDGLTLSHVQKWNWILTTLPGYRAGEMLDSEGEPYKLLKAHNLIISEENGVVTYNKPIVCWPDPQMRLYKNASHIQWEGKVHERLTGFKHFSALPYEPEWAIQHEKVIARQEAQNNYYETIQRYPRCQTL